MLCIVLLIPSTDVLNTLMESMIDSAEEVEANVIIFQEFTSKGRRSSDVIYFYIRQDGVWWLESCFSLCISSADIVCVH